MYTLDVINLSFLVSHFTTDGTQPLTVLITPLLTVSHISVNLSVLFQKKETLYNVLHHLCHLLLHNM